MPAFLGGIATFSYGSPSAITSGALEMPVLLGGIATIYQIIPQRLF